jgi:hypothetical protein
MLLPSKASLLVEMWSWEVRGRLFERYSTADEPLPDGDAAFRLVDCDVPESRHQWLFLNVHGMAGEDEKQNNKIKGQPELGLPE